MVRLGFMGAGGVFALFAQADFKSTVTLGSIITAALVVIAAGVFSLRDRRNAGWKDLFDQERAKNVQLLDEKEAERVLRHDIKDELATCKAQLEIERSKPDLTVLRDQQGKIWADVTIVLSTMQGTMGDMQRTQQEMLALLQVS